MGSWRRVLPSTINMIGASYASLASSMPSDLFEANYENMYLSYTPFDKVAECYEELVREAARRGKRVPVVHAPYESWVAAMGAGGVEELVNRLSGLGVKVLVFHLPSQRYGGLWREAAQMLHILQERYDVEFAVENLVAAPPWRDPYKLAEAAARHGLKLCLDTGHLHLNGLDVARVLRDLADQTLVLHVHDNHGVIDEHLVTGAGTINWLDAAPAVLECVDRGAWLVLEEKCIVSREGLDVCKARLILQYALMRGLVEGWNGFRELLRGGVKEG